MSSAAAAPPRLLRPALSLTDRLRTSARLGALIAVLLVPAAYTTWSFAAVIGGQVAFTAAERDGVRVLRPALTALATTVGGGTADLAPLGDAVAAVPELGLRERLDAVTAAAAKPDAGTPGGRAATAAALVDLVTATGNASNLILDPDLDSFYVMDLQVVQVPKALLAAAQAAAPVPGAARTEAVADQAVRAGAIASAGTAVHDDVETAVAHTALPGLAERLARAGDVQKAATALAGRLTSTLDRPAAADPRVLAAATLAAVGPDADALDALLAAREDRLSFDRTLRLAVTVVAVLLGVWLAAAVLWRTRHDVRRVLTAVTAISTGDLGEHPVPDTQDELGDIGRALAAARAQLAAQGEDLARSRAEREEQIRRSFATQRAAEQGVRTRAQSVIDETAAVVIGELGEVVGQVDAVRRAAGTIDERVRAADTVTRGVVEQAQQADHVVTELGRSLQQVASMAQLINGVADQTKLLALNATIEAARAGEAGRGFAVVADEVKNLAMTTARSTEEITSTIASLERDAAAMSSAITSMTTGIKGVDEATGVLAGVATEQHRLVEDLERCIGDAITRVSDMGSLTARLERRRSQRVTLRGTARVTLDGRRFEAGLRDVGEGGVRCAGPQAGALQAGQVVDVEFEIAGVPHTTTAVVAAPSAGEAGDEVGLQFLDPTRALLDAVRAYVEAATGGGQEA